MRRKQHGLTKLETLVLTYFEQASEPVHGYQAIEDIEAATGNALVLTTLYRNISELEQRDVVTQEWAQIMAVDGLSPHFQVVRSQDGNMTDMAINVEADPAVRT